MPPPNKAELQLVMLDSEIETLPTEKTRTAPPLSTDVLHFVNAQPVTTRVDPGFGSVKYMLIPPP
jgi:hypothetical protein